PAVLGVFCSLVLLTVSVCPSFAAGTETGPTVWRVTAPPTELGLAPFYKKYVSVSGYPIVASAKVNDYALKEAAYLVSQMFAGRNDLRQAMVRSGSHLTIMAYDEFTTDVPEHAHL